MNVLEIALICVIGYLVRAGIVFLGVLVLYKANGEEVRRTHKPIILFMVLVPISVLIILALMRKQDKESLTPFYLQYTIRPLLDVHKEILKANGFDEGNFVSETNVEYTGLRYKGLVRITDAGRVCFFSKGRKAKEINALIRALEKHNNLKENKEKIKAKAVKSL